MGRTAVATPAEWSERNDQVWDPTRPSATMSAHRWKLLTALRVARPNRTAESPVLIQAGIDSLIQKREPAAGS
ncbi:hypothetical protein GCM10027072_26550 [Streptomyces bullii]